jgi:hypothetical protein
MPLLPGYQRLTTVACDSDREGVMQTVFAVVGKENRFDFPEANFQA